MKNKIHVALIALLIGSWGTVWPEMNYMDQIKMGHRIIESKQTMEETIKIVEAEVASQGDAQMEGAIKIGTKVFKGGFYIYGVYSCSYIEFYGKESQDTANISSDKMRSLKRLRHSAWYRYQAKPELGLRDTIAWAVEYFVYPVIDSKVEESVNKLNAFDCVKNIAKNIPKEHHSFIADNGKFVLGAGANRIWRVYADQDIAGFSEQLSQNIKIFAKDASKQLGCAVAEQYVVKPMVKKIINEDCFSQDVVSVALNIAAYSAIHSMVGK